MEQFCAALLACVLRVGYNPDYVHQIAYDGQKIHIVYDGLVDLYRIKQLESCAVTDNPRFKTFSCNYHSKKYACIDNPNDVQCKN